MLIHLLLVFCLLSLGESTSQGDIDNIGQNLHVNYVVADNFLEFGNDYYRANLTLTNNGQDIPVGGNWRVYFTSVQMVEPDTLRSGRSFTDQSTLLSLTHEKGYLFSFGPAPGFRGIQTGKQLLLSFRTASWSVSRYEQMPNWYVAAPGLQAAGLVSTAGESLAFVGAFIKPNQYKRFANDQYQPWTPEYRYERNDNNTNSFPLPLKSTIIPRPMVYQKKSNLLKFSGVRFAIVSENLEAEPIVNYFQHVLRTLKSDVSVYVSSGTPPNTHTIHLKTGSLGQWVNLTQPSPDAYMLDVDGLSQNVAITGASASGVFYGVISLVQLLQSNHKTGAMPGCRIVDWPRYEYRGMMMDTARNFKTKDSVLSLLEMMAMYKLNKFHFHLTDDEGWRLQIPGLPELTDVGGRRCHDPDETKCVMPTLGSGPDNSTVGSGYYTVEEYKEILKFAADRHIEVIPEIDMPGHAHSAIRAMRARNMKLRASGKSEAEATEYDLDEETDTSDYLSVQFYKQNAVNPCMNSTYRFTEKVFLELQKMHDGIQPLKMYHFGGDEVAHGAWVNSSACRSLLARGVNLKEEFTRRVSAITRNVTLGGWEDGLMDHGNEPWTRERLENDDVTVYAWQNVWEWGGGARAHILANAGYKVVLSAATDFYFDQPQEPSPDERGFYWATRYTDTHKTFKFMPDNYYLNIAVQRSGQPITLAKVCGTDNKGCPPLIKKENIIGIQGALFSETVRTPDQFDFMVMPRLLALAERAWHRADWEGKPQTTRLAGLRQDWTRFSRLLGGHHLALLDLFGVKYRVPPPGARQYGDKIKVNVEFPGLPVQYQIRSAGHPHWEEARHVPAVEDGQKVVFRTGNPARTRFSQEVEVIVTRSQEDVNSGGPGGPLTNVVTIICLIIMCIYY